MAEHIITGTLVYAIVRCAECGETWEQPGLHSAKPGWIVCPHCNAAAPAVIEPASPDADGHDWHGAFCSKCGAPRGGLFVDRHCPWLPG